MLKVTTVLLILFLSLVGLGQNYIAYHNLCNEGCQLLEDGLYVEAKDKILDAIDLVDEPLSADYFNLAKCYSQLDAPEATEYYLDLSLKLTKRGVKKYIEHSLWFEPVFGKEKWNEILQPDYLRKEPTEFQSFLIKKMDSISEVGQHYLNLYYDSIVVYHPYDSVLLGLYRDSIAMNNKFVSVELEYIINEHGWPGIKLNGFSNMDYRFVFGRSAEWFFRLEEKLIVEIEKGNLHPWVFADMADRAQGEKNLPCKYHGVFCKGEVTSEIRENCKKIGAPLGKVKKIRRLN